MKRFPLSLCCLLVLCSCVSRQQADEKLEKGCKAATELFLEDGFTIKEIKDTQHKTSPTFGKSYREVTILAIETDEWLDVEKNYRCIFAEEFNMLGSSHRATLYQLNVNDQTYGFKDGKIIGDMKTHMNIKNAVERAMTQ
ncbi:MAG: hypothetical protein ACRBCK_06885 [Alphaproteobacteria bacterium]